MRRFRGCQLSWHYLRRSWSMQAWIPVLSSSLYFWKSVFSFRVDSGCLILGDPGAVSWVGRKGTIKVFKYGRKSPWVLTLTELFPKIQVDAGSWLGTKKCFVLLCPIGEQFLLSSFREFVHDGYCLATLAWFVHQTWASKENFYFLLS